MRIKELEQPLNSMRQNIIDDWLNTTNKKIEQETLLIIIYELICIKSANKKNKGV